MTAPNTGSILTSGGANATKTSVSTNIIIESNGVRVGAIQTLNYTEKRQVKAIDEVGTDGHIDSVPSKSVDIDGQCTRIRFNNHRIASAFGLGFVHVAAQRIPFDIKIYDIFNIEPNIDLDASQVGNVENVLTTVIKNIWITSLSTTYQADNFVISDGLNFQAEHIFSYLGSPGNSAVQGGERFGFSGFNQFELAADTGDRRGALDGAGLLIDRVATQINSI